MKTTNKYLQMYDADKVPMIASDGRMSFDGRKRLAPQVMRRNASYKRNFPHKVAFYYSVESIGSYENKGQIIPV